MNTISGEGWISNINKKALNLSVRSLFHTTSEQQGARPVALEANEVAPTGH